MFNFLNEAFKMDALHQNNRNTNLTVNTEVHKTKRLWLLRVYQCMKTKI